MKRSEKKELERYQKVFGDRLTYDMTPEEKKMPITREVGETLRHRLEKRWYRRLVVLNILMIVVVIALFAHNFTKNYNDLKDYGERLQENYEETMEEPEEELPMEVTALAYGVFILVAGYIFLYIYYAMCRSNSVRITENNFPEVYHTIEQYAGRLGIRVPKVYIKQESGVLNAFSTFLFRRQWILIHAEIFEVAYREHHDMDALNFVIAHEMSHIYYGHATLHYNLPIWFAMRIPVIGAIASRTREFSCDRLAQRLSGVDGMDSMLMLPVDRHLYKMVDKEDYLKELCGMKGFFIWFVNMIADHPIMSKRILALQEGRGSGKVY